MADSPDFNLFDCGTPSTDFNLQACDYLSPEFSLADVYGGQTLEFDLSAFITFDIDVYSGAYADCDFTTNPVDELDGDALHGSYAEFSELDVPLSANALHGSYAEFSELDVPMGTACFYTILDGIPINATWQESCYSVNRGTGNYGAKYFTFTLAAPRTVILDVTSSIDAYMYLIEGADHTGTVIQSNDDGGSGTNSRITIALSAGDYTIEATTFSPGQYGDFAVSFVEVPPPVAELDADAYGGSNADADLASTFNLPADAYAGGYADADFTTHPAAILDADAYGGSNADADLEVPIGVDAYGGSNADADLEIVVSEGLGVIDAYGGSNADADLAPTYNLPAQGYSGAYADADMATTTTISTNGYSGAYADADLLQVFGDELPADGYHGGLGIVDALAVTVSLFPRALHGSVVDGDITIYPAVELTFDFYHGAYTNIPELDELNWNMYALHGSNVECDLALQFNLPADGYSGAYVELEYLNGTANLPVLALSGGLAVLDSLFVPLGEGLAAEIYHGAYSETESDIKTYAIFTPHPIIAGIALYDADHNHNHCDLAGYVDPLYGDNVIRWDWNDFTQGEDYLVTEFADTRLKTNWNPCDSVVTVCSVELLIRPRFEVDMYAGESMEAYLPKKFTGFGDVPDDVLYDENTNFINIRRMYFEVDMYAGASMAANANENIEEQYAYSGANAVAELTKTPFGDFITGVQIDVNLSVSVPAWRTNAFQDAPHATLNFFTFDPVFWTKFCHGYIRPNGEAVVFDFDSEDNTGCDGKYYMEDGSTVVCDLSLNHHFDPEEIHSGSKVESTLVLQTIWLLYARGGEYSYINNPELSATAYHGTNIVGKFVDDFIFYVYGGEVMDIDTLTVTGAAVAWVTDANICLPNEYIPLTDDGDLDYNALDPDGDGILDLPDVAVEDFSFYFPLFAQCVSFDEGN